MARKSMEFAFQPSRVGRLNRPLLLVEPMRSSNTRPIIGWLTPCKDKGGWTAFVCYTPECYVLNIDTAFALFVVISVVIFNTKYRIIIETDNILQGFTVINFRMSFICSLSYPAFVSRDVLDADGRIPLSLQVRALCRMYIRVDGNMAVNTRSLSTVGFVPRISLATTDTAAVILYTWCLLHMAEEEEVQVWLLIKFFFYFLFF